MSFKSARIWQDILLFGGLIVGLIGVSALNNLYVSVTGLVMMALSIIVWWRYYRCPECGGHLGRGAPKRCPNCGARLTAGPEPEDKKPPRRKKKKR